MTVHFKWEHRKVTSPAGRRAAQHQFHRQSHFRICGCWLMYGTPRVRAEAEVGREGWGRGICCSPTQTASFTSTKVCGSIFGTTFDTSYTKAKIWILFHRKLKQGLVRAPMGDCAFRPLLFPHDTKHQPACAPPQRPSPCRSSAGGTENKWAITKAIARNKSIEDACRHSNGTHRVVSEILWRIFEGWPKVNGNLGKFNSCRHGKKKNGKRKQKFIGRGYLKENYKK